MFTWTEKNQNKSLIHLERNVKCNFEKEGRFMPIIIQNNIEYIKLKLDYFLIWFYPNEHMTHPVSTHF